MVALVPFYDEAITLTLSTLAAKDSIAVSSKLDSSQTDGFFIAKARTLGEFSGSTVTEGPVVIGVAINSGASAIETAVESDPQSMFAVADQGKGTYIKPLGMIRKAHADGNLAASWPYIDWDPRWTKSVDQNVSYWAYNMDSSALQTGTVINFHTQFFGRWIRD